MKNMDNSGMGLSGISPEIGGGISKINRYRDITDILVGRSGLGGYNMQNPGKSDKRKTMYGLFSLGQIKSGRRTASLGGNKAAAASSAPKAGHQGMGM